MRPALWSVPCDGKEVAGRQRRKMRSPGRAQETGETGRVYKSIGRNQLRERLNRQEGRAE